MEVGLEGFFTRPFNSNPCYIKILMNKHFLTEISLTLIEWGKHTFHQKRWSCIFAPIDNFSAIWQKAFCNDWIIARESSELLEDCFLSRPRLSFLYLGYGSYSQLISLPEPMDLLKATCMSSDWKMIPSLSFAETSSHPVNFTGCHWYWQGTDHLGQNWRDSLERR